MNTRALLIVGLILLVLALGTIVILITFFGVGVEDPSESVLKQDYPNAEDIYKIEKDDVQRKINEQIKTGILQKPEDECSKNSECESGAKCIDKICRKTCGAYRSQELKIITPNGGETLNGVHTIKWESPKNFDFVTIDLIYEKLYGKYEQGFSIIHRAENTCFFDWDTKYHTIGNRFGLDPVELEPGIYTIKICVSDVEGDEINEICDETDSFFRIT